MPSLNGENNFPVLMMDFYAGGCLYTLTVPDNFADIYKFPDEILTAVRRNVMQNLGIFLEGGAKTGFFLYNNQTFVLESFKPYRSSVKLHIFGKEIILTDLLRKQEIEVYRKNKYYTIFRIELRPGSYKVFQYQNKS